MKIGIDAKWFFEGPPSGKVVIQNLVKNIAEYGSDEHQYYFFISNKSKDLTFPYSNKNIHLVYVWSGNNLLSNILVVPLVAMKFDLDILIFQNFVPMFATFRSYAFIHDVIFESHPEFYSWKERLYFLPLKVLTKFAAGVCTVSESEKIRMASLGYGTNENIDVIYHGADDRFRPLQNHFLESVQTVKDKYKLPDKFILFVGRLNVRKNVENLLRAVLHIETQIPLVLVGGYDWKSPSLDALINNPLIKSRLILAGPVYGDELPIIYSLASVFCFPSYEESFGLPALEAMASGVPVVVSNTSSLPEICGQAGTYVDPKDPQSISSGINSLLSNPDLYQEKKKLGLEQAAKFKWEFSAKQLIASAVKAAS